MAQCFEGHSRKRCDIIQAFDVHANHAHARIAKQGINHAFYAVAALVSYRNQIRQGHRAALHREVQTDVTALGDQGHAPADAFTAMLVWPQRHTVEVVEHAVAVGADQGHGACVVYQLLLQGQTHAADLGKSRGITNRAARATLGELAHDVYGGFTRHGDKAGIRGFWQRRDIGKARQTFDAFFARVHRPQLAGKAELSALPYRLGGSVTTEHRNMAGRKKPTQRRGAITAHRAQPPCSRSMAREIMWR